MADYRYERLSALDSSFLVFETPNTPMHVASTAIFDAAPITKADGGIDIDRILAHVASRLHRIPRYRERLAYIPVEGHPVWIDDERFNLSYHVRHTSLPKPGDERQLKRLSARIMSQQLDQGKPLWEMWIVEGLEGGRFAMVSKTHHCMIDGISGVDLMTVLLSPTPDATIVDPMRWIPRPAPSPTELLRDEMVQRLTTPRAFLSELARHPRTTLSKVRDGVSALAETVSNGMQMASDTPLNQPIGPHRRFDWLAMELAAIQEVRHRLGGTVNDIVLTTVAGAVRRFLERRAVNLSAVNFRVFVPVSLRAADEHGTLGNRVAGWIVDLPIAERDAGKRLAKVREHTARLKESRQTIGAELLSELADWGGSTLLTLGMRLASQARPFNLVVTNVPGPPHPLYLLGARMIDAYPMVPLFVNLGLGIALFSNAGKIFWGFNADWDVVPDLHDFVGAIGASFAELLAAQPEVKGSKRPRPAKSSRRARAIHAGGMPAGAPV